MRLGIGIVICRRSRLARLTVLAASLAAVLSVGYGIAKAEEAPAVSDLNGMTVDEQGQPLAGVHVQLWFTKTSEGESLLVAERTTADDGAFAFEDVPTPPADGRLTEDGIHILTTKKAGRQSGLFLMSGPWTSNWKVRLPPAAKLSGRVTNASGAPVQGAVVAEFREYFLQRLPGDVRTATTDEHGRYSIDDLRSWDATGSKATKISENLFAEPEERRLLVSHRDFALTKVAYRQASGELDIELEPGASIEGKVIDRVTGDPARGVLVQAAMVMVRTDRYERNPREGGKTRTDEEGRYRLESLPAGTYNVFAHPDREKRAAAAIDSLAAKAGMTTQASTIELVEGGWLEGRLLDADTREPLVRAGHDEDKLSIDVRVFGPDRPRTGASSLWIPEAGANGTFRMRVAPGKQYVRFGSSEMNDRYPQELLEQGIDVASGETVQFDMLILSNNLAK